MGTTTLLTLEQFERIEGDDHLELLKGELIRLPPPQYEHMQACEDLYDNLKIAVKELRARHPEISIGKAHMEMGYFFPGDPPSWLRPDVSITYPNQTIDRYYIGAPLIVFEIVSEFDTAAQIAEKVALFLANGAKEVWVIYPETRSAWLYDGSGTAHERTSIATPLLPGIEIQIEEIL
ncbi:MAG TPA: Uma2 family endonuclease [Bryobacteraceae bacterium]|jgi:Uma2 family endonuclease